MYLDHPGVILVHPGLHHMHSVDAGGGSALDASPVHADVAGVGKSLDGRPGATDPDACIRGDRLARREASAAVVGPQNERDKYGLERAGDASQVPYCTELVERPKGDIPVARDVAGHDSWPPRVTRHACRRVLIPSARSSSA